MDAPDVTRCRLSLIVEDRRGVIARIVTTITGSGTDIEELAVGPAEDGCLRLQVAARGPRAARLPKRLHRLVHVRKVVELPDECRHVMVMRLRVGSAQRPEIMALLDMFGARVLTVEESSLVIDASGSLEHLDDLRRLLKSFPILGTAQLPAPALPVRVATP